MKFRKKILDEQINRFNRVIKSLENRGISFKGTTTTKTASQEGEFLNFLRPLKTAVLPLMKSVLTPLAKSVLIPLGLSSGIQQHMQLLKRKFMDQVILQTWLRTQQH